MKTTRLSIFPSLPIFLTSLTLLFATAAQAQVPSYVPTNGLVGYWPFNGNANDESGNGNNGTAYGATLSVDRFGSANKAYSFNGGSQKIQTNYPGILGQNARSISIWYLSNSIEGGLLYYGLTAPGARMNIYLYSAQSLGHTPTIDNSNSQFAYYPITSIGTWNHLVIAYDPSFGAATSSFKFYLNGDISTLEYFNYNGNQIFNTQLGDLLMFGSVPGQDLYGKMDDIGIWNRALTASEVLALYNGCNVPAVAIAGSNSPGPFTNSTYTCGNNDGSTYTWTVSNGVIESGQGTNSVSILWGSEGIGSVSVLETTADGCYGDPVSLDVNVQCVASGNAIEGFVVVEEYSNSIYTCNGAANSSYQWTVTNGIIESGQGTNSVTILWASAGAGNIGVVETTYEGCEGTTLSQDIVVAPGVNIEEFSNAILLFPNPATTELNLQITSDLIGTDLFVFDALGKQILKQQILSTNTIINASSFAVGNYVVKVGGGVKKFNVEK